MDFAPPPTWQPVDREAFVNWLERLPLGMPLGMAGGYTRHPVAYYLNHRQGGLWALEVYREEVYLLNRHEQPYRIQRQAGWLLDYCWELRKPDAYRDVTAADALAALERVS